MEFLVEVEVRKQAESVAAAELADDAGEYTFRVAGRQSAGVVFETYLVG